MDVSIDADPRLAEGFGHYQIGGFPPDAVECEQVVDTVGDLAVESVDEVAANSQHYSCLGPIEANRIDELRYLLGREFEHRGRSARAGEEAWRCDGGCFVLGAQAQDTSDQREKRIMLLGRHQREHRRVPSRCYLPENAQHAPYGRSGNSGWLWRMRHYFSSRSLRGDHRGCLSLGGGQGSDITCSGPFIPI